MKPPENSLPQKSINIFCGARLPKLSQLQTDVHQLARLCVERNYRLVYGGGDRGVMGWLQQAWLREGGQSLGILPEFLREQERLHDLSGPGCEVRLVTSLSERKQIMADESDLFLILPGGFGTLDEFTEVLTWRQLNLHHKPICLYNCEGFFTPLLDWMELAQTWGLVDQKSLNEFHTIHEIGEVTKFL